MRYRLDVFRDAALSERVERLSLSARSEAMARSDAMARERAEAVRWRCECAGRSRAPVPTREDGAVVARMGSRRLSGYGD